ncbi:DUF58 domain-containing protein [Candidatus Parabeggiatoa sp. HSG14]|uniref:DUF58 domain-containing protein n=1 Tax=Candidatus Parabeggiatoa sp. HSG14 TaxID=3055593 RepID=UPI0025A7F271|nr:DUF58 domain-containing protein [Thiotrichales bacterium HSG14]
MRRLLFHNFYFVFALSHWIQRRFTKAGMLLLSGLIVAGTFGIDTKKTLAYQFFSFLLALLLLAFFSSWFFRARFTAQRDLPQFATVGKTLHYQVQVQNNTQKLQRSLVLQENVKLHPPSFETFLRTKEPGYEKRNWFDRYVGYPRWTWLMRMSRGAEITAQNLPPLPPSHLNLKSKIQNSTSQGLEIKMALSPLRRGYVHFTSMTFARSDPFGLFNAFYTVNMPDNLLVLPKRYPVGEISLLGSRKYQRGGVNLAMSVGDSEEFISLREYRPGDPLRLMHWKSWARLGKPVVKEYQDEFFVRHALILDTFTEQSGGESFEEAVSVAASFACAPRSYEVLLDLMFIGTTAYRFTSGRGVAPADKLLEVLACVSVCADKPFSQLSSLITAHIASLSGCVCVLLNWDSERQQLIQQLKNADVPLLVVVISNTDLEIDPEKFPEVHVLPTDAIAEELAKI